MDLLFMYSMFISWGVKVDESTEIFRERKTGKLAHGRYFNNFPRFPIFGGDSGKLQSEGFFDNGNIIEYKIYDKSGFLLEHDSEL